MELNYLNATRRQKMAKMGEHISSHNKANYFETLIAANLQLQEQPR